LSLGLSAGLKEKLGVRPFALGALALALVATIGCSDSTKPDPEVDRTAEQIDVPATGGDHAPDRYIVVFKPGVSDVPPFAAYLTDVHRGTLHRTYESAIHGFCATLTPGAADAIRRDARVASVEPDRPITAYVTQVSAPWALDRVDQRDLPLNNQYVFTSTGVGVNIYIIDSGIRLTHGEFGGRAQYVPSPMNGDFVGDGHGNGGDCYGHGTAVAGVAAGATYGVAKDATLWAARVLDCNGNGLASMALEAVDWITAHGQLPAVVNMSLGYGGDVPALRQAVENSIAAGFVYTVAAGNFIIPQDACLGSPANAPNALTVGACDILDREANWSAFGACVDLLGPGVNVTSASHLGDNATAATSGTSMAAPEVAGTVALFLEAHPEARPTDANNVIIASATTGRLTMRPASIVGGTPNRLLHTNLVPFTPPPNAPPIAAINVSVTGLACAGSGAASSDGDGSVVGYAWDFGDGSTASGMTFSHVYATAGSYTISLTVTDDDAATDSESAVVSVEDVTTPGPGVTVCSNRVKVTADNPGKLDDVPFNSAGNSHIPLSISVQRVDAGLVVALTWKGTGQRPTTVYRDGHPVATVEDGAFVEYVELQDWTYQICAPGVRRGSKDDPGD
jgi:subtilisin family serine protease